MRFLVAYAPRNDKKQKIGMTEKHLNGMKRQSRNERKEKRLLNDKEEESWNDSEGMNYHVLF
ncbi:hypothetical protein [Thermodesulfovibrio sp.]|uniref:hypothetical protein n=1 Tax=Thermodesulfovibrio sp. TaxID=2067987 RepID=UPI0030A2FABE